MDEGISGDLGRVSTHHSFSPASCDADVFLHIPLNTKEIWTGIPHQIRIPGIPDLCGTHLGREPSSDEDDEKHVSAPLNCIIIFRRVPHPTSCVVAPYHSAGAISAGFAPSCVHLIGGRSGSGGQSVSMALECGTLVMGSMAPKGSPHSTLVSSDQTGRKEATFSASGAISGGKEAEIAAAVLSQYIEAAQIPDGFAFHAVISSDIPTTSGLPVGKTIPPIAPSPRLITFPTEFTAHSAWKGNMERDVALADSPALLFLQRLASFALSIMTFLEQLMDKRIAPLDKSKLCSAAVR